MEPVDRIGPYDLLGELGRGAMGVVHRARHRELGREVALKVMKHGAEESWVARFKREMLVAASVTHPNVVQVYDGGADGDVLYLAMELIAGTSLDARLSDAPEPPETALATLAAICDGLEHLHARGIAHRDVKPANVMVGAGGLVKVVDFGLARRVDSDTLLTGTGVCVGTPRYWPPELFFGEKQTGPGDVWAAGAILYRLLTGRDARDASTMATLMASARAETPDVRTHVPQLSEAVAQLCTRMLAREPAARPGAGEAAAAARAAMGRGGKPPSRPSGLVRKSTPSAPAPIPSRAIVIAAGACGALLLAVIFALAPRREAPPTAPPVAASTPASAAPAVRPAPGPRLFAHWRDFAPYADRLKAGGSTAKRAVEELRVRAPLPIGASPEGWWTWLALGPWLEAGARGPAPSFSAVRDPSEADFLTSLAFSRLMGASRANHVDGLAMTLEALAYATAVGDFWLAFGWMLERDGEPALADHAYRCGLERLGGRPPLFHDVAIWIGVSRAIARAGAADPVRAWWQLLKAPGIWQAHEGAKVALDDEHPDLEERIYRAGLTDPVHELETRVALARFTARVRKDPESARAQWAEIAARFQKKAGQQSHHAHWLLSCGRVEEAEQFMKDEPADGWIRSMRRTALEPLTGVLQAGPHQRFSDTYGILLARLCDAGRGPEAVALLQGTLARKPFVHYFRAFDAAADLAGAGHLAPDVVHTLRVELVLGPRVWAEWDRVAGALASDSGRALMAELLDAAAKRWAGHPFPELARAVWLSRRGLHAEALPALTTARATAAASGIALPVEAVAEILAAPFLDEPPASADVKRAATEQPLPAGDDAVTRFVAAVRSYDDALAATIAEQRFESAPGGWWGIARWQLAARSKDAKQRELWRERVRFAGVLAQSWTRRRLR
jgi:hypothetical protein